MTVVVAHQVGDPLDPTVEEGVGVRRAVRADPQHFQRLAVVQLAGDRPPGDGDADEFAVDGSPDGELAADRGQAVPVVLGDELVRFSQMQGIASMPVCKLDDAEIRPQERPA